MAARTGLSASTVGRIWRQFDLRPHLQDGLTLAANPGFVDSVVALVGLYRHPPEQALVLCAVPREDRPPTSGSTAPVRPDRVAPRPGPARDRHRPERRLSSRPARPRPRPTRTDRGRPTRRGGRPAAATSRRRVPTVPGGGGPSGARRPAGARGRRRPGAARRPGGPGLADPAPPLPPAPDPAGGAWADQVRRWSGLLAARHPDGAGPVPPAGAGPPSAGSRRHGDQHPGGDASGARPTSSTDFRRVGVSRPACGAGPVHPGYRHVRCRSRIVLRPGATENPAQQPGGRRREVGVATGRGRGRRWAGSPAGAPPRDAPPDRAPVGRRVRVAATGSRGPAGRPPRRRCRPRRPRGSGPRAPGRRAAPDRSRWSTPRRRAGIPAGRPRSRRPGR